MQQVSGPEFLLMAEICCQITIYFRAVNIFQICSFVIILKTQCASYSRIRVFFDPYFFVFFQSLLFQTFTKMTQKRYNNCTFNIFLFFFFFLFFFAFNFYTHWTSAMYKKLSFPLSVSSVNVTKCPVSGKFGHIY